MYKGYEILDTESTRDFANSLIGGAFRVTGNEMTKNGIHYIELDTCDGELWFADDEIKEVRR